MYPQILVQQSMQTWAESNIVQILELKSVATKIQVVHFVFYVEHDAPPSQKSADESAFRTREPDEVVSIIV